VIDLPVLCFVCADVQQQVLHRLFPFGHIPVPNGNFWCPQRAPSWYFALINVLDCACVRLDSLFFNVADKAVAGFRRNQV
jgi:hypothetical protein